jgi:hypothetical protein
VEQKLIHEDGSQSPAGDAFDEAIELSLGERMPYPEKASFIDLDRLTGKDVIDALEQDMAVVVVGADGSAYALKPEPIERPCLGDTATAQAAAGVGAEAEAK